MKKITETVAFNSYTIKTVQEGAGYNFKNKLNVNVLLAYIDAQIEFINATLAERPDLRKIYSPYKFTRDFKVISVDGPRGFGFTTVAKSLAASYNGILYVPTEYLKREYERVGIKTENINSLNLLNSIHGQHYTNKVIILDGACEVEESQIELLLKSLGPDNIYILIH